MIKVNIIVDNIEPIRIDKFLVNELKDYSRSFLKNLFDEKKIILNGKIAKPSIKVSNGDKIYIEIPKEKQVIIEPENIDLDIVYEDEYIAIINKPENMTVHPTETNTKDTLVNAIMYRFPKLSDIYLPFRPGIVHRLDKDTTGLIIVAKDNIAHQKLEKMFKEHQIKKTYLAIVNGKIIDEEVIDLPIGRDEKDRKKMSVRINNGKNAITRIYPVSYNDRYTLLKINIDTGRTHQIRVHLKYRHNNIVGDKTYGIRNEKVKFESQLLHAFQLEFLHPITKENINVSVKPNLVFKNAIKKLQIPLNDFIDENIL
ncbi:RluA family pseudouridine synthase [Miniphocaeibacter massiliensis]|uniref:RluA family pseudouridine synthase n=1 Tax=Miniphocaeibacter massiliensis TaxID=2041841 RepID=UPI000C07AAC4|nr:RluA family pseudouridine synthase [Miniphocaeibacter massiliensis]